MLRKQELTYLDGFQFEIRQAMEEGREIPKQLFIDAEQAIQQQNQEMARRVYHEVQSLPLRKDYPYSEPETFEKLLESMPDFHGKATDLYDSILGAWFGRCAGCLLGQPVEGWKRSRILGLLEETGNYPLKSYISSDIDPGIREKYAVTDIGKVYGANQINWINNVHWMPEDDDTNYMIIALKLLEHYGLDFSSDDVAENWLDNLPLLHLWTAERLAYRNFSMSIYPPESAYTANPYREWIGAQIRTDFYGYIAPGLPRVAAEMAWKDGVISHVRNGVYGGVWIAVMLSLAASIKDIDKVLCMSLDYIPPESRLHEVLENVVTWKKGGANWENSLDRIHDIYDENCRYDWCHVLSNAMIVMTALLHGDGDLEKTLGIALSAGFDTDCNAATAGSIIGMINGASRLPEKWIAPLHDTLLSGVDGFSRTSISSLAQRTMTIAEKIIACRGK